MNVLWWILLALALFFGGLLLALTDVFQLAVLGSAMGMVALILLLLLAGIVVALLVRGWLINRRPGESRRDRLT